MHTARITRQHPALLLLLVDQSGSMDERVVIRRRTLTKAEYVAEVVNGMIGELLGRCRREEGCRDYFRIGTIGYSDNEIRPLIGNDFTPLSTGQLAALPVKRRDRLEERRLPDGQTCMGNFPTTLWVQPAAGGNTPMYRALSKTHELITDWVEAPDHRQGFPPMIINISDGEATDADRSQLVALASQIKALSTADGGTLLLNIHIQGEENAPRAIFPRSVAEVPVDLNARTLYEMSSELPEVYERQVTQVRGDNLAGPFRGLSYNTPLTDLVAMMNIGSVSVTLIQ